jgi:hypothetical protein
MRGSSLSNQLQPSLLAWSQGFSRFFSKIECQRIAIPFALNVGRLVTAAEAVRGVEHLCPKAKQGHPQKEAASFFCALCLHLQFRKVLHQTGKLAIKQWLDKCPRYDEPTAAPYAQSTTVLQSTNLEVLLPLSRTNGKLSNSFKNSLGIIPSQNLHTII